uniref:Beta-sarcoglycan n=1 Tax=Panagrolaimus sp. ES5 TaxID=591445 RepID=A0AC34GNJ1_9BILA
MKSSGPRYLRKRSSDATTSTNVDNEYPKYPESKYLAPKNQDLNTTGLREKKLLALIIWLAVLFLLALILLILNILIINVLQMSHHGMKALKIYNYEDPITHEEESVVHFTAAKSHFDHVTVESGKLFGPKNQNFQLRGSRVILGEPTENTTKFLLQEGKCKFENVDQFVVLSSTNKKTLFSAQHPLVSIDHKIKKLSSSLIITNKVRSPVNEDLKINGENVVIRGNEGIQLEAKAFNISAATVIALNTSVGNFERFKIKELNFNYLKADGNLYFSGRNIYFGNQIKTLLMSSSPALSASIEAFRVCICKTTPTRAKIFLVNGNRPCVAPASICK